MPVKSSRLLHITSAIAIVLGTGVSWAQSNSASKERPVPSAATDAEEAAKKARESKERGGKPGGEGRLKDKAQGARESPSKPEGKEAAEIKATAVEASEKKDAQRAKPDGAATGKATEGGAAKAARDDSKKKAEGSAAKTLEDAKSAEDALKKKAAAASAAKEAAAKKEAQEDTVSAPSPADAKKAKAVRGSKPVDERPPAPGVAKPQDEATTPARGDDRTTRPTASERGGVGPICRCPRKRCDDGAHRRGGAHPGRQAGARASDSRTSDSPDP